MMRLASAVIILLTVAALAGCSGASSEELAQAREEGAAAEREKQALGEQRRKQAQLEARIKKLEAELAKATATPKKATGNTSPTGSSGSVSRTSCGGNLSVGSNTTCPFAENVRSAWNAAGGGSVIVSAYSPVTGRYYAMSCTAGVPTICRGGNSAVVYIR